MNPSDGGLSTSAKTGIVLVLVILVLGSAYLVPPLLKGGGTSSVQPAVSCPSTGGANQTIELLTLFECFSQMQMQATANTLGQPDGSFQQQTVAYNVLGTARLNSAPYTKVEFTTVGANQPVVAWCNSTGGIDRLDVISDRNYTGPGAAIIAQAYTSTFGLIPALSNNASLLSMLSKTTENTTSIGPMQLKVATYQLPAPTSQYKTFTVQYATIPGTDLRFVVYLHEKTSDGAETTIQVQSITGSVEGPAPPG
jgi:hypothetical protein